MKAKPLILSLVLGSLSLATAQLEQDLVSYWTFDAADITDPVVADVHGDNEGAFVGAPAPAAGIVGEALTFDGSDDAVEVVHPADGSLDFGIAVDFTISAWVKTTATVQTTIVSKNDGGTNSRFLFKVQDTGQLFLTISPPGAAGKVDFLSNTTVNDGEWHHVVMVADRDTGTYAYIDGEMDAQAGPSDGADVTSTSNLRIGSSVRAGGATRRYFNGSIDDVAIWGRALTAEEVAEIHTNGLAGEGVTGGDAPPFAITHFDRQPGSDVVSLTWISRPSESYIVKISTDGIDWSADIGDSLPPDPSGLTTHAFDLSLLGLETVQDLLFRVEKE